MAVANQVIGDLLVLGNLQLTGSLSTALQRSNLAQESAVSYPVPWTHFRKHDAYDTNLSSTAATTYLGVVGGTWATGVPSLQTGDLKNAGSTTRYARVMFQLPPEYVSGGAVTVRLHSGMVTTVASSAASVDVECYKSGRETLVSGSDLCTTAATTNNSLTFSDKDFTITPTALTAGDILDIRVAYLVNDSGTGTAVIGCIGSVEVLLSIKG